MALAQHALGIGAGGVEITQRHVTQAVGMRVIFDHLLDDELSAAIWADRPLRIIFRDRQPSRHPICGAGAGKDDGPNARFHAGVEQLLRTADIRVVIFRGLFDRFADVSERGEMKDGVRSIMTQRLEEPRAVADIAFDKVAPATEFAMSGRKIVVNDGIESDGLQQLAGVTSDEPSSARDKNLAESHVSIPFFPRRRNSSSK